MTKSAVARFSRNSILVQNRILNRLNGGWEIHQKASTACSCTMFPSTGGIVEPGSKGTDLTTHHTISSKDRSVTP